MRSLFVVAMTILTAIASPAAVPVRLTGHTGADAVLQKDIVQQITYFGLAFDCPAPTEIRASALNASMIAPGSSFAINAPNVAYEKWDAEFCGKTERFFVAFWPDPAGGSFLSVTHPYPAGAPGATLR